MEPAPRGHATVARDRWVRFTIGEGMALIAGLALLLAAARIRSLQAVAVPLAVASLALPAYAAAGAPRNTGQVWLVLPRIA